MIKVAPGHERLVHAKLLDLAGIQEIYYIFGDYDFFISIELSERSDLQRTQEILRDIAHVDSAKTVLISDRSETYAKA